MHELGADAYARALTEHRQVLRAAFAAHRGVEIDTQGDAFFVAFQSATDAVAAARAAQAVASGPVRVRIGLHTGTPNLVVEGYVGVDVFQGEKVTATRGDRRPSQDCYRSSPPRERKSGGACEDN